MEEKGSSILCDRCGAPLTPVENKAYLVCSYCGAYFFPEASADGVKMLGESASMNCPVCKTRLVTAMIEDIHILACPECRGIMINQSQLAIIVQALRLTSTKVEAVYPLNPAELKEERYCQACGHKMDTHPYEGGGSVVVDVCYSCKVVWFDYGELKKVITAPDFGLYEDEFRPIGN